jgi:hypothetical protein
MRRLPSPLDKRALGCSHGGMDKLGKVLEAYGMDPSIRTPIGAGWEVAQRWKQLAEEHLYFFVGDEGAVVQGRTGGGFEFPPGVVPILR